MEGSLQEDSQEEGSLQQGNQEEDNLELEVVVDGHMAAHRMVEEGNQLEEERPDLSVTSVERWALPLLEVAQTYHLFYPFRSCAVSAYMRKLCSKQSQKGRTVFEKPPEFHHFQQS